MWLPLTAQAADHGNWDDGWAYFENNLEPATPTRAPAPSQSCAFGVIHGGSPCDCVQSPPIDYEFEGECVNPFGNDEAFLSDFLVYFNTPLRIGPYSQHIEVTHYTDICTSVTPIWYLSGELHPRRGGVR